MPLAIEQPGPLGRLVEVSPGLRTADQRRPRGGRGRRAGGSTSRPRARSSCDVPAPPVEGRHQIGLERHEPRSGGRGKRRAHGLHERRIDRARDARRARRGRLQAQVPILASLAGGPLAKQYRTNAVRSSAFPRPSLQGTRMKRAKWLESTTVTSAFASRVSSATLRQGRRGALPGRRAESRVACDRALFAHAGPSPARNPQERERIRGERDHDAVR